jgi:hypothetical protein
MPSLTLSTLRWSLNSMAMAFSSSRTDSIL